jgi:hypothetical protein
MHPSDGNTHAIERHLAEQEAHDAAQPPDDLYCAECDEKSIADRLSYFDGACPYCAGELEEAP